MYNRDGTQTLTKIGSSAVSHRNGTAYIVNTSGEEIPVSGMSGLALIDFMKNSNILNGMYTDISQATKSTQFYVKEDNLDETIPTESVHHILVEREYTTENGEQILSDIKFKRLSVKSLASDIEVLDMRLNSDLEINGLTDAETLINYIMFTELDLDTSFDPTSNKYLMLDNDSKSTSTLKLKLKTADELNDSTDPAALVTAKAGLNIKKYITETIAGLYMYKNVILKQVDDLGAVITYEQTATHEDHTLIIKTDERTGLTSSIDAEGNIKIDHAYIGNNTTIINSTPGKIEVINGVYTDTMGHITGVSVKNISNDIAYSFPTKKEVDSSYVKKTNPGTEVINSSVEIMKNLTVRKNMVIKGNLYVQGATAYSTSETYIKDNIIDIGDTNDNINRYTGVRFRVKSDTDTDTNIFFVYDNENKAVSFFRGSVDTNNSNIVNMTSYVDVAAASFDGVASSTEKLFKPIKLQFSGDVSGVAEFYGNEGILNVPLTVKKASASTYGIVRLLDDLDVVPDSSIPYVYSSVFLYNQLKSLRNIVMSNDYMPTTIPEDATPEQKEELAGKKTLATQQAIYSAYKLLVDFQKTYDASRLAQEAAARKAATYITPAWASLSFNITRDTDVPPIVSGVGYDEVHWNNDASINDNFYELWQVRYKMRIAKLPAGKPLFTVMNKRTGIVEVHAPKIGISKTPYALNNPFKFVLQEFNNAGDTIPVSSTDMAAGTSFNIDKEYIGYDLVTNLKTSRKIDKFLNHVDFSDWTPTSLANFMISKTNQWLKVDGAHSFISTPTVYQRDSVAISLTALNMQLNSKELRIGLSDIDDGMSYMIGSHFKIDSKASIAAGDTVEMFIYEYTSLGKVKKKSVMKLDYASLLLLNVGVWYCVSTAIKNSAADDITDTTNTLPGIYNLVPDTTIVLPINKANLPRLTDNDYNTILNDNIVSYEFVITKSTKVSMTIAAPVMVSSSKLGNAPFSALLTKNYDAFFYSTSTEATDASPLANLDPTKYYSIVAMSLDKVSETSLLSDTSSQDILNIIPTATTLNTVYDDDNDERNLIPPPGTDGIVYPIAFYRNRYGNVSATVKRETALQRTVAVHKFLEPVRNIVDRDAWYFKQNNNRLFVVQNLNNTYENALIKYDNGWKEWTVASTVANASPSTIQLLAGSTIIDIAPTSDTLNKWTTHNVGDVVGITADSAQPGSLPGFRYYTGDTVDPWLEVGISNTSKLISPSKRSSGETLQSVLDNITDVPTGSIVIITHPDNAGIYVCKEITIGVKTLEKLVAGTYTEWFWKDTVANVTTFSNTYGKTIIPMKEYARVATAIPGEYELWYYTTVYVGGTLVAKWEKVGMHKDYVYGRVIPYLVSAANIVEGTHYVIPNDDEYVVVDPGYVAVDNADPNDYNYSTSANLFKANVVVQNLTWDDQGLFSAYRKPIADYDYTGSIQALLGNISIPINITYTYINKYI